MSTAKCKAREKADRESHTIAIQAGLKWKDGHHERDLRRGRRRIYGGLLAFIDKAVERGAPPEVLLQIPVVIEAYIKDLVER